MDEDQQAFILCLYSAMCAKFCSALQSSKEDSGSTGQDAEGRLARKMTEVAVHLKRTPQALFAHTHDEEGENRVHDVEPNVIIVQIQLQEAIRIAFGAKLPGVEMETGAVELAFNYEAAFRRRSPDAYETLLLDAMRGRRDVVHQAR